MSSITGVIKKILNYNAETERTFALIGFENNGEFSHAKMGVNRVSVREGDVFQAFGKWNAKRDIFNADRLRPGVPTLLATVEEHFLKVFSEEEHGISARRLREFIYHHGREIFNVLDAQPDALIRISKDPERFRDRILATYKQSQSPRVAEGILKTSGLAEQHILRIIDVFRQGVLTVLEENPYRLAEVQGLTFEDIDRLGRHLGISPGDPRRLAAGIDHHLRIAADSGSTYVKLKPLISKMIKQLDVRDEEILGFFKSSVGKSASGPIVDGIHGDVVVSLPQYVTAENAISLGAARLLQRPVRDIDAVTREAEEIFRGKPFDEIQKKAVIGAVCNSLFILTGGPGTGKSTVMKLMVELTKKMGDKRIYLSAPTNEAARRLAATTGDSATTVYALLDAVMTADGRWNFRKNKDNPLPSGAVVVIDEASMVDVELAAAVMAALPEDGRLILVGDKHQLPSVGAGAVLADLLGAAHDGRHIVPSVELKNVYRTKKNSKLAKDAYLIRDGLIPSLDNRVNGGVVFVDSQARNITLKIRELISNFFTKPLYLDGKDQPPLRLDPRKDICILAPQAPGPAGTWELNAMMSLLLNPHGEAIPGVEKSRHDDTRIPVPRVGDRIIVGHDGGGSRRNRLPEGVNNGSKGEITGYRHTPGHPDGRVHMTIRLDTGQEFELPAQRWRTLLLGYAMTVHKSQGNQYPLVILPLTMAHVNMLDRTLLYTGWTRAENLVCGVGEKEAFEYAIRSLKLNKRQTRTRATLENFAKTGEIQPKGDPVSLETNLNEENLRSEERDRSVIISRPSPDTQILNPALTSLSLKGAQAGQKNPLSTRSSRKETAPVGGPAKDPFALPSKKPSSAPGKAVAERTGGKPSPVRSDPFAMPRRPRPQAAETPPENAGSDKASSGPQAEDRREEKLARRERTLDAAAAFSIGRR